MNIILEIQNKYNSFTQKEKELVDYLLKNKNKISNINITTLSKEIGVSPSTITRFSKKINCENFVELKMKFNLLKKDDKLEEKNIFSDVYNYYEEAIKSTNKSLDEDSMYSLVNEIKKANRIFIYGVGSSGLSAQEMTLRLLRMGFSVLCITDPHIMIINSVVVSKKDLVISISISGETTEIIDSMKICKKNKAKTVGISGSNKTSLGEVVDELILIPNSYFIGNQSFLNSQFSVLYLFDLISKVLLTDKKLSLKMQKTIDTIRLHNG